MAIEIVDFPMKNGDFQVRHVKLPEVSIHYMGHNIPPTCLDRFSTPSRIFFPQPKSCSLPKPFRQGLHVTWGQVDDFL